MKQIRFTDRLHVNAHTNLSNLRQFALAADELITNKIESKRYKGTYQDVVILPIKKPAVLAAKYLYDYSVKTTLKLFNPNDAEQLAKERFNSTESVNAVKSMHTDANIIS